MVVLKPNVVRGGKAIGLGNNLYLMKGRTHSKGGIDIGKNPETGLEVERDEVVQVLGGTNSASPKGIRVFSAQPILGGISPAQYILGGANPNRVFAAQEQWKKVNKINDDGTKKARFGTEKDSKRDSAQVNIFRPSQDNSKVQANRIAHRKSLENFIKDNPNLYGINTADFVDFMLDNATMESNNSPTASHGSMYGYYQLKGLKKGSTEEQQHRAAYKHLSNLFKNVITDADIEKAKELGISQAQLLHKFWNQERKVLNYLYQGKDDEDGLGTKISEWGNNNNLEIDYFPYVMKSFNDRNYIIQKGDNPESIMKRYRGVGNETRTFNDYNKDAANILGLDYSKPLRIGQELSVDVIGPRKKNGSFRYGGRKIAQDGTKKENKYIISSNNPYNLDFLKTNKNDIQIPLKGEKTNKELKEEYKELKKSYRETKASNYNKIHELQSKIDDIGEKIGYDTLKQYPFILSDAFWDSNDEKSKNYLIDKHIRENNVEAKDVLDFYKSYVKSEGINRILNNQKANYKKERDDFINEYGFLARLSSPKNAGTKDLKYGLMRASNRPIKVFDINGPEAASFYKPWNGHAYVYRNYGEFANNKDNNPYLEVLGHEIAHHFNYITPGQKVGLDINEGYKENGHDEKYTERQADLWAMKYLLYHNGIYDSRSNKDITSEEVKKLRELYPNIRIFRQMSSDDDVAKMLNLVADSGNKKDKNQYSTNYAKYGGIHIKPSKRGTFTAAAKKHGMSVQGFASKVLANKSKYSSAMIKKANFARNASKWKHKEFGGDMDFNYYITKDNIYKLGGRKKALIGDDMLQSSLIVANNGSNLDAARNKILSSLPTTKSILTSFRDTLTPIEQKINKEEALRTIMSNQKDGLGTSGLSKGVVGQYLANGVQAGINIAGNIGSYLINRDAIRRMRGPAAPLPLRAEILPTRVSTVAQEAALRENVAKQENLLAGNLSSSRSRLNATNQIRNQGIGLYNQLQERKGEIERELITRDKLNRQGITNQNIAQVNQWRNASREFENKRIDLNSENTIQHLIQGPADAIAGERGFFDNLASNDRYRMTAFLEAIKNPDALRAMNSDEIKQLARRFGVRTSWLRSIGINI